MKECEKDLQGLWQSWEFLDNSNSVNFDVSQMCAMLVMPLGAHVVR